MNAGQTGKQEGKLTNIHVHMLLHITSRMSQHKQQCTLKSKGPYVEQGGDILYFLTVNKLM